MLVLSRKKFQTIKLGDDIEIVVTNVIGGNVKIGINAPKSLNIVRGELQPLTAPDVSDTQF